jgi:uncharacterized protein YndB with AHSA1/START domain
MAPPMLFPSERDDQPTVHIEQPVAAAPDLIWKALSSAQGLARWQADEASGEVREGGTVRLSWGAFGANVELKVVACVPHQVLRMRHRDSEVEFSLSHHQVQFAQYGVEPGEDVEGLFSSWTASLAQLAHSIERHPGRRRSVEWMVRTTSAAPETLHLFFTQPALLRSWLGEAARPLALGETYEWTMHSGTRLTGRVLALVPGRDVALSCDNLGDGLIVLRSIPNPLDKRARFVAASVSQWGRPARTGTRIVEQLDRALLRLANASSSTGAA